MFEWDEVFVRCLLQWESLSAWLITVNQCNESGSWARLRVFVQIVDVFDMFSLNSSITNPSATILIEPSSNASNRESAPIQPSIASQNHPLVRLWEAEQMQKGRSTSTFAGKQIFFFFCFGQHTKYSSISQSQAPSTAVDCSGSGQEELHTSRPRFTIRGEHGHV